MVERADRERGRSEPARDHGLIRVKVSLVRLTMQQKDALNVLLTGRAESGFADLIRRMIASKGLEFDMVCLKPEVGPNNQPLPSASACVGDRSIAG